METKIRNKNVSLIPRSKIFGIADQRDFVLDGGDLLDLDAQLAQLGAEKMRVDVLGLARQDLVADDDDASGFRHSFCLLPQCGDERQRFAPLHR